MNIEDFLERKDVVINVQPVMAISAIGLLRSYLPYIMDHIEASWEQTGTTLHAAFRDIVGEVLDEIYKKCITQTDIEERLKEFSELYNIPVGVIPSGEKVNHYGGYSGN